MESMIGRFEEKHPDLNVETTVIDREAYKTQIRNFLTADAPDVATWYAANRMRPYVEAGLFEDVSDLWEEDMWQRSLDKLSTMFTLIGENYYTETDHKELAYASIKGMLPTLDPHSYFLDPTNLATMTEDYRGKYFGIGCLIQKHGNYIKVISPIEGGPSYRLGILPNDVISHIDGESTQPITSFQAMQKLPDVTRHLVFVAARRQCVCSDP